jgi:hypothetical protein
MDYQVTHSMNHKIKSKLTIVVFLDGSTVGLGVGLSVGELEESSVGLAGGFLLGESVGGFVGGFKMTVEKALMCCQNDSMNHQIKSKLTIVGFLDGSAVGVVVGLSVGEPEKSSVGLAVGFLLGASVGGCNCGVW